MVEHVIGNDEADGSIPSGSTNYPPGVVARFWSKVDVRQGRLEKRYCWEWRASLRRDGYGQFKPMVGAKPLGAHRVAWEIWNGCRVPSGLHVLHSCDNPKCCNPDHLRVGTHNENMADMRKRGRHWRGGPRRKDAA